MELIKRLFGGNGEAGGAAAEPVMTRPENPAIQDFEAQLPTRRELVRVRTRNTLRMSGIPEGWVEPQVLLEPEGGRTCLHLRLVVRHWDERLQRYAVALQNKLMAEIERIDPQARQWLLSIVWLYPADLACPFPELPQPSEWLDARVGEPKLKPEPEPEPEPDEVQSDLAQLFAVRDADMSRPDAQEAARRG